MAEISQLLLSSRTLFRDDLPCEWDALAAARPPSERGIGAARAVRAVAHRRAHILFPDRIADTNNHVDPLVDSLSGTLDMDSAINSQ